MKAIVSFVTLLLACLTAAAQIPQLVMTVQQERAVYETLIKERVWPPPPAGVTLIVGTEMPREIEVFEVPAFVDIPLVRRYRYTVMADRVILVDPGSRKVMRIIPGR
jgi:hypothetical protein